MKWHRYGPNSEVKYFEKLGITLQKSHYAYSLIIDQYVQVRVYIL